MEQTIKSQMIYLPIKLQRTALKCPEASESCSQHQDTEEGFSAESKEEVGSANGDLPTTGMRNVMVTVTRPWGGCGVRVFDVSCSVRSYSVLNFNPARQYLL